jgi:hypothetical protein
LEGPSTRRIKTLDDIAGDYARHLVIKNKYRVKQSTLYTAITILLYVISLSAFTVSVLFFIGVNDRIPDILGYTVRVAHIAGEESNTFRQALVLIRNTDMTQVTEQVPVALARDDGSVGVETFIDVYDGNGVSGFMIGMLEEPTTLLGIVSEDRVLGTVVFNSAGIGGVMRFLTEEPAGRVVIIILIALASVAALFAVVHRFTQTL